MNKNKNRVWLKVLNSGLLIAILGILIQHYFFKSEKQTQGRIELRKGFVKDNYPLYNQLIFWTTMNSQIEVDVIMQDSLKRWKKTKNITAYLDPLTHQVSLNLEGTYILRFLVDSTMQKVWNEYTKEIDSNKFKIDPDILKDYNYILQYKNQMQLTKDSTVTHLTELGWIKGDAFNKWIDMNIELRKKIKSYTDLE